MSDKKYFSYEDISTWKASSYASLSLRNKDEKYGDNGKLSAEEFIQLC